MKIKEINGAQELWKEISKAADFQSNVYDATFLADIREKLSLDSKKPISNQIQVRNISSEELIAAFLKAIAPFSKMLTDLMKMFEKAGAQAGDNNIQIQFDFKKSKEKFSLNLDQFMNQINTVRTVRIIDDIFEIDKPWEMHKQIRQVVPEFLILPRLSEEIEEWLSEYETKDNWPKFFPMQPESGVEIIDQKISVLWKALESFVGVYKNKYDDSIGRRRSIINEYDRNKEPLWQAETDLWVGAFMRELGWLSFAANESRNIINEIRIYQEALDDCISLMKRSNIKNTIPEILQKLLLTMQMDVRKRMYFWPIILIFLQIS